MMGSKNGRNARHGHHTLRLFTNSNDGFIKTAFKVKNLADEISSSISHPICIQPLGCVPSLLVRGAAVFDEDILFGNTIIGVSMEALRGRGYPVRTLYLKLLPVDGEMYTPAAQPHEHVVGDYMVASKHPLLTRRPCWRSAKNMG